MMYTDERGLFGCIIVLAITSLIGYTFLYFAGNKIEKLVDENMELKDKIVLMKLAESKQEISYED